MWAGMVGFLEVAINRLEVAFPVKVDRERDGVDETEGGAASNERAILEKDNVSM